MDKKRKCGFCGKKIGLIFSWTLPDIYICNKYRKNMSFIRGKNG